jgi:Flp pilus assembly protein TadB
MPSLAPRVRPYAFGRTATPTAIPEAGGSALQRVFGPPLHALVQRVSRAIESRTDEHLARLLRQAGTQEVSPDAYRVRQVARAFATAAIAGAIAALALHAPLIVLVAGVAGFVHGATRARRQLERAITARASRLRLELYTVNHLLAVHVRTGAGAMQAVRRVVDRGHGAVVDELADVLAWTRRGMGEAEAFRRAAELTAEPSAARSYQLLAAGVERGVDLATGLLALSEDLRDARREQLHKDAVRRRAAMLVPTIAILAPIMLLFIAAPLPSIVLGHR